MKPRIRPIFPGPGTDTFLTPHLAHWQATGIDVVSSEDRDLDFFEWLERPVIEASRCVKTAPRIVRLHSYEAFDDRALSANWPTIDACVFVSRKVEDLVHDRFALNVPTFQARNGIDLDLYTIPTGKTWRVPRIAFLGNVSAKKGPMLLCQVIAAICAANKEATFHIAGRWDDPRFDLYFRDFIVKRRLERRVEVCGPVDDVRAWLADKAYILATSPFESFGAGIGEAIACGCLPMIHDWPGSDEHWGFTSRWQTVEECVDYLTIMTGKGDLERQRLAEGWREDLAERCDRHKSLVELRTVVDQALEGTHGPDVVTFRERRFLREQDMGDFLDAKRKAHCKPPGIDRVLVHMPPGGGYGYIAENYVLAFEALGYRVRVLRWDDDAEAVVKAFKPDLFLGCWERGFLDRLPDHALASVPEIVFAIGCFEEADPEEYFALRKEWGIDPRCHFWTPAHDAPPDYPNQHHLPYAAMPTVHHHHQARVVSDLAFIGTLNPAKKGPIDEWILPIADRYLTQIWGVGWGGDIKPLPQNQAGALYCSAKVCPNVHQPSQHTTYRMVNERTFVIPACGGFEIVDAVPVIGCYYDFESEMAVAGSPEDMRSMVEKYLLSPRKRRAMALKAHWRTIHEHTYMDRVTEMMAWMI